MTGADPVVLNWLLEDSNPGLQLRTSRLLAVRRDPHGRIHLEGALAR